MCINGHTLRQPAVVQLLPGLSQTIDLTIVSTPNVVGIELTGYQFYGVTVPGGDPYSPFFTIGMNHSNFNQPNLVTNSTSAAAGNTGIACPLEGSTTVHQYDDPRVLGYRSGVTQLPTRTAINFEIKDIFGNPAQFTSGYLYCDIVYEIPRQPIPLQAGVDFNHSVFWAPSAWTSRA